MENKMNAIIIVFQIFLEPVCNTTLIARSVHATTYPM